VKVLFFAPHAAIWLHAFPEALIARVLQQEQVEVVYVGCGTAFQAGCIPMRSFGLTPEAPVSHKQLVCAVCETHKNLLRSEFNLRGPDVIEHLTADELAEVDRLLATITPNTYQTLELDGLPVGRVALYEFLIQHKRMRPTFTEQEWLHYQIALRNTLCAFFACRKILEAERPDALFSFNSLYSVNHICALLGDQRGIVTYFSHLTSNLAERRYMLWVGQDKTYVFLKHLIQRWPQYRSLPCLPTSLARITNHFLEILRGQSVFVYSAKKSTQALDIRQHFNIPTHHQLIVALMGSPDENVAAEAIAALPDYSDTLFPLQTDWLAALLEFASQRPNLTLIIRVHPREFPNKREGVKSEHARQLEELLRDLPPNVRVNWPSDQLSLYDLMEETDVFLNSWSSAGKEMSLFGLPVVVYSQGLLYYPADLNYLGRTRAEYFELIDRALVEGWSFERIRQTYRWHVLEFEQSAFDLSAAYSANSRAWNYLFRAFHRIARQPQIPLSQTLRKFLFKFLPQQELRYAQQHPLTLNLRPFLESRQPVYLPPSSATVSLAEETEALKYELRRLIHTLYASKPARPGTLHAKLLAAVI